MENNKKACKNVFICLLIIIVLIAGFLGIKAYQKYEMKQRISTFSFKIQDVSISNENINIYMNDINGYDDLKTTISTVNEMIRKNNNKDQIDADQVRYFVNNNSYKCDEWNNIFKIGEKYSYSKYDFLLDEFKINKYDYAEYIKYLNDSQLSSLIAFKNEDNKKNELDYQVAIACLDRDDNISLEIFNKISGYKDSTQKIQELNEIHKFDGFWRGTGTTTSSTGYTREISHTWIINGKYAYNTYSDEKVKNGYTKYYAERNGNQIFIRTIYDNGNIATYDEFVFNIINDSTITYDFIPLISYTGKMTLNKESNSVELPNTTVIKEPSIGMTKSEVENSTWGKPNKVNKTTTKYGVHEQWVYSGNKYIYFDDGVVTGIQDY